MPKFYFTYGSNEHFPWQDGWTEVEAPSLTVAQKMFSAVHPDRIPNVLNCAWFYTEEEFNLSSMKNNGNFGGFCHEKITVTKEVDV